MRHGVMVSEPWQGIIWEITQTNAIHTCQIFGQVMCQIFDRIVMNEQREYLENIKNVLFENCSAHRQNIIW